MGLLGLLALLPLAVWLAIDALTDPNGRWNAWLIACLGVVLVLAAFGAFTRLYTNAKHLIRAGVFWEGILFSDRFPTTEEELVQFCIEAYERENGKRVLIPSHGWSWYLKKQPAQGPRVWTTRFVGSIDYDSFLPLVWRAGTALAEVKKNYAAIGRTLIDTPSMEWLSLASWIVSCSHGHPGLSSKGKSPLHWVERARVLDLVTKKITDDDETILMSKFHSSPTSNSLSSPSARFVILTVQIRASAVVEDIAVQRFAARIDSPDRLLQWKRGQFVRLMFISRHRRSLGIVWTNPTNGVVNLTARYHMHPHLCSRIAFWQHSDVDSALPCNCWDFGEKLEAYDGYAKMSEAFSGINPQFFPLQTMLPQILCVFNHELICPIPSSKQGDVNWLFNLIIRLEDFHYNFGGRTELRLSGDDTLLYLDLSIRSVGSMKAYHSVLFEYGIQKAAQHAGKYVSESILPIREVSVSSVLRPLELV